MEDGCERLKSSQPQNVVYEGMIMDGIVNTILLLNCLCTANSGLLLLQKYKQFIYVTQKSTVEKGLLYLNSFKGIKLEIKHTYHTTFFLYSFLNAEFYCIYSNNTTQHQSVTCSSYCFWCLFYVGSN